MEIIYKIEKVISETGFYEFGHVEIERMKYYQEIREICKENMCGNYGISWACPPAIGTLEECRTRVNQYDKMILFSQKYSLEDSFDFEGMVAGLRDFKKMVDLLQQKLDDFLSDYLLLSNEGCGRCSECTYPDAPCRFPHLLHHSLEGYGFIVNELAGEAGVSYNNGPCTVTYFGALLFKKDDGKI